ncbi:ATP-binding protein [Embleya hyalina]|uniref:ATP-binding protein n=1 Tax=Embleya hyalina TaxID=516124 RepID=A0A401YQS3_9ACTN|nr:ATP-binding protein [Embleya hyalina]GCD96950.1 ATP-binding protein [Embleya hyalina]
MTTIRAHTYMFTIPSLGCRVAGARQTVLTVFARWGVPVRSETGESIRLVASELITNAVEHAGRVTPDIAIVLQERDDGTLRLGVRDRHPGRPRLRARTRAGLPTSGRGLAIVRAVLAEVGGRSRVERHQDGGKTVWAEIPPEATRAESDTDARIESRPTSCAAIA